MYISIHYFTDIDTFFEHLNIFQNKGIVEIEKGNINYAFTEYFFLALLVWYFWQINYRKPHNVGRHLSSNYPNKSHFMAV